MQKNAPPDTITLQGDSFKLFPQFHDGTTITEAEADRMISNFYTEYVIAEKRPWQYGYVVYTCTTRHRKVKRDRLPATHWKVNGVTYVIFDPLGFFKTASQVRKIKEVYRFTYKILAVKYKEDFIVYRSVHRIEPKERKKLKAVKKRVKRKTAPLRKKKRTKEWLNALPPRLQRRYAQNRYEIVND